MAGAPHPPIGSCPPTSLPLRRTGTGPATFTAKGVPVPGRRGICDQRGQQPFLHGGRDHQLIVIAATANRAQDGLVLRHHHVPEPAAPRAVLMVAFDGMQLLDLAGPVEVFQAADVIAGGDTYDILIATPSGRPVRTSSGVEVGADLALEDVPRRIGAVDTVVVVGGTGTRAMRKKHGFLHGIQAVSATARRTTSVCTGALVLAA